MDVNELIHKPITMQTTRVLLLHSLVFFSGFISAICCFGEPEDLKNIIATGGRPGVGTSLRERWRKMIESCEGNEQAPFIVAFYLHDHDSREAYEFWLDVIEINERSHNPGAHRNSPHSKVFQQFEKQIRSGLLDAVLSPKPLAPPDAGTGGDS